MSDEQSSRITPYNDSYATCERTCAKLLIYPGRLDPRWVTRRLGVQPTKTRTKGERKPTPRGGERVVPLNAWFLSSEGKSSSLDLRRHLDWLLDKIEPATDALKELQRQPEMKMAVACVWWSVRGQGGPTLWPEQMRRLADLNLECAFDIAFFGEDDD